MGRAGLESGVESKARSLLPPYQYRCRRERGENQYHPFLLEYYSRTLFFELR